MSHETPPHQEILPPERPAADPASPGDGARRPAGLVWIINGRPARAGWQVWVALALIVLALPFLVAAGLVVLLAALGALTFAILVNLILRARR